VVETGHTYPDAERREPPETGRDHMDKNVKPVPRQMVAAESDPGETSAYIADMTGSLATLARRNGMTALAYILDMAREEAQSHATTSAPARLRQ
jgi:hypothetical protein